MEGEGTASRPPTPEPESAPDSSPPPAPLARGPPPHVAGASAGLLLPPPLAFPRGPPSYSAFPLEAEWPAPVPPPLYEYPHDSSGFSQQYLPQAVYNNGMAVGSTGSHGSISYAVNPGEPYVKVNCRQRAPKRAKLFVFYVANEMTNDALYRLFELHGTILNLRIATENLTGRGKGYAFVDYASAASAENAIRHLDGKIVMGRRLKVERKKGVDARSTGHHESISYAVNPGEPYVKINCRQQAPKKAKLFVFYVANEMTNDALYRLFEPHGTILNLKIATENHTGRGMGYAFVDYASAVSAENAIHHLHRKIVMGRRLKVEHKKETSY